MAKTTQSRKKSPPADPLAKAVAAFLALDHVPWVTALMLASLLEPQSTSSLQKHLAECGVRDADEPDRDRAIPSVRLKEALALLRKLGIVTSDGGTGHNISPTLSHRIVGASAPALDKLQASRKSATRKAAPRRGHRIPAGTGPETAGDRGHNFQLICQHLLCESGIHHFGFYGRDRSIHVVREIRTLYWLGEFEQLAARIEDDPYAIEGTIADIFLHPLDAARLSAIDEHTRAFIFDVCLLSILSNPIPCDEFLELLTHSAGPPCMWRTLGETYLLRGEEKKLESLIADLENNATDSEARNEWLAECSQLRASLLFFRGEIAASIAEFQISLEHQKGNSRRRKLCPRGLGGVFFTLALCRQGDAASCQLASQYARWGKELNESPFADTLDIIDDISICLTGGTRDIESRVAIHRRFYLEVENPNFLILLFILLSRLAGEPKSKQAEWRPLLERLVEQAERSGFLLLAWEAASLRDTLPGAKPDGTAQRLQGCLPFPVVAFSTAFKAADPWEKTLLGIEKIAESHAKKAAPSPDKPKAGATSRKELFWVLEVWDEQPGGLIPGWNLIPFERSISKTGRVSKGKKIALRRLKEQADKLPFATDQDRVVSQFAQRYSSWGSSPGYEIVTAKALLALAGHPLIYTCLNKPRSIELTRTSPRLDITDTTDGGVSLLLVPDFDYQQKHAVLLRESETRFSICEIRPVHRQFGELLHRERPDDNATEIPAAARERLLAAISSLSNEISIEADQAIDSTSTAAESIEADATPHLRLIPGGSGLDVRLLIRPVAGSGIDMAPGEGKAVLFAAVSEKRYQATRDLESEKSNAERLIEHCSTLRRYRGEFSDAWQWHFDGPADCLQLLAELHTLDQAATPVIVEWPEGQPFRVVGVADTSQLRLSLGGAAGSDFLKASGELPVGDDLVLSMRQLLDLLDHDADGSDSDEVGRRGFVKIGESEYLVLSENLKRQLGDLKAAARTGSRGRAKRANGNEIQIHPLAAFALQDLTRDATLVGKQSKSWRDQFARIEAARDHNPEAPASLRADLRPYQLDGYRWLSRLAILGAGACLADDMGLGKTVQALALLIERAKLGPSLVVAPTSVAANWINETLRFAPSLTPLRFGDGDRAAMLAGLRPGDLVILSYGLLHSEIEQLAAIEWNTVVLDEAQLIKNSATQRSKAAMKLRAGFRIITTGTPVENRLAELHNLFQFVNPGLMGSWETFQQLFAEPIEVRNDPNARSRLRRLIRPFLLRRLKSEVLRDLPPRTDIELSVEPSEQEVAFYEALRQKAVDTLESGGDGPGGGAIRILAELTRLRRACCHPRLIDPDSDIVSSKQRVFAETLEEILAGGHKVLVFSQFVDHLNFVREHLETEDIAYQYLDGSTPTKKRQQAVDSFQAGDGDVFLISLKAGGFGLNLTAADYVIHLDPWWNPAAEDQASDRAHRIGQQRPVTVYRLIVKDTIEEKIVNLHHRKRELAESLLEGSGKASRLSPEDMLELLRS